MSGRTAGREGEQDDKGREREGGMGREKSGGKSKSAEREGGKRCSH